MSKTIIGILISVGGTLLVQYGFTESCSNELITNVPLIVGGLIAWIGRVKVGGVNWLGVRKTYA